MTMIDEREHVALKAQLAEAHVEIERLKGEAKAREDAVFQAAEEVSAGARALEAQLAEAVADATRLRSAMASLLQNDAPDDLFGDKARAQLAEARALLGDLRLRVFEWNDNAELRRQAAAIDAFLAAPGPTGGAAVVPTGDGKCKVCGRTVRLSPKSGGILKHNGPRGVCPGTMHYPSGVECDCPNCGGHESGKCAHCPCCLLPAAPTVETGARQPGGLPAFAPGDSRASETLAVDVEALLERAVELLDSWHWTARPHAATDFLDSPRLAAWRARKGAQP